MSNKGGEIAKFLFEFEEAYAVELGSITVENTLVWPIIKSTLYFHWVNSDIPDRNGDKENRNGSLVGKFTKDLFFFLRILSRLLSLFVKRKFKRSQILFYTSSVNRHSKNKEGKFVDYIIDGFILKGEIKDYIYVEDSVTGSVKTDATIKADLLVHDLSFLAALYRKFSKVSQLSFAASNLHSLLSSFLEKSNKSFSIPYSYIESIIINFNGDYKKNLFLLKLARPEIIITSEKVGSGLFAAARSLNIKTVDLQHGLMDPLEPMYQFNPALTPFKAHMALPDVVGVWGKSFKQMLLSRKFWVDNEIAVLGNVRMDLFKEQYKNNHKGKSDIILFPTQWTVFEETRWLLENLSGISQKKFHLKLKLHPLEPAPFKAYFYEFYNQNKQWFSIAETHEDIYTLISQSRLVLGFYSTTLLEAINLSTPAITLSSPLYPSGIHYYLGGQSLSSAIREIEYTNIQDLIKIIDEALVDDRFYENWVEQTNASGFNLFADNYVQNANTLINYLLNSKLSFKP